jgi:ubiquinone/menaquinone biosynthesis C-methylase UbiE
MIKMNYQKESNNAYIRIIKEKNIAPSLRGGRYDNKKNIEKKILQNIIVNLNLKKGDKLIDIGCGAGPICDYLVKYAYNNKINLTLNDIPEIISFLKKKYKKKKIKYISGEFQKIKIKEKYNKVLCYSVLQCTNNPKKNFKKILNIVTKKNMIFIGDIPNISKKIRFLKSEFGKKFEEKRIKKKIGNINDYIKNTSYNRQINDELIKYFLHFSKKKNYNFFILKQNKVFPFSFTREDILLEKF